MLVLPGAEPHDQVARPSAPPQRQDQEGTGGGMGREGPGEHPDSLVQPTVGKKAPQIPTALKGGE
jgi:hypothetical protein